MKPSTYEYRPSAPQEEQPRWRSINGTFQTAPIVPEEFHLGAFLKDPGVRISFVVALLGIALAGVSAFLASGTVRSALCILGAVISMGAVSQITGYINKRTAYEILSKGETSGKTEEKKTK